MSFKERGVYICIEGARSSTRAEPELFRSWGADVIGMTLVPECVLVREVEICYASLGMVTDYDVWKDKLVNAEEVLKVMKENNEKVKGLLELAIEKLPRDWDCECRYALKEHSFSMNLKKKIRTIPNFPKRGIMFMDMTPLLKDEKAFREAIDKLSSITRIKI